MRKITVFLLMIMFCIFLSSPAMGQEEIKVGTLLAHSGPLKDFGSMVQNAVILAGTHLTSAGLKVSYAHEDSQTSPGPAVNAAKKLVENEKVVAIIGAQSSAVTMAVAEAVTIPNKTILISPASTASLLTTLPIDKENDFLFRTCPSDALQGVLLGELATGRYESAAVMYINNAYGKGLADQFKKSFELRGGTVLAMVPHTEEVSDSYVSALKTALAGGVVIEKDPKKMQQRGGMLKIKKPDVLCVFSYPDHAKKYVKEAIDSFGYKSFLFCDGTKSEEILKIAGPENLDGMVGTAPATPGGESSANFSVAFRKKFGDLPPVPALQSAYDAMAVIGLSAHIVQTKGLPLTSENIRDNLRLVANPPGTIIHAGEFEKAFQIIDQGGEINYRGSSGPVDFDENGDVITPMEMWRYSDGEIRTFRIEYIIPKE